MNTNADAIKQNVSMKDILNRYGLSLGRRGAMRCPFHREKTPSFKIYDNGKKYHCFGCGEDGDVISFTMKYYNINYAQAITRLATEFGIPLRGAHISLKDRIKAREERTKRKQAEKLFDAEEEKAFNAWIVACDEVLKLKEDVVKYAPKVQGEPFHEKYCKALRDLPFKTFVCDVAEIKLKDIGERRHRRDERNYTSSFVH